MPNKNYVNGRAKEYRTMKRLRDEGYDIVVRTAGSHGAFDVVGIRSNTLEIKLIQCKPKSMSESAKAKIITEHYWLNNEFSVSFEVE
jgi:Holliday junction resolvase